MKQLVLTMVVLPPTLNDQIASARANKFTSASTKKKWTDAIALACHKAKVESIPGTVWLEFIWRVKNFRRDADNIVASCKFVMDGLVAANVIDDDNLSVIKSPVIHHFEKSDHDGLTVFIRNERAWYERLRTLDAGQSPSTESETVLSVSSLLGNAPTKRKTPTRARARIRAFPSRRK